MRALLLFPVVVCLCFAVNASAQQTPDSSTLAQSLLASSLRAMGGTLPNDATATGTITITAGGGMEFGQIRCIQRGADQIVEDIDLRVSRKQVRYSRGLGATSDGYETKPASMELAVSSRPACSPLSMIAQALTQPGMKLEYVAREPVGGKDAHRIRIARASTNPRLTHMAEFSARDIWLDGASYLPLKVSYFVSEAVGAPRIAVEFNYSEYRNFSGILFPTAIQQNFNGTPYAMIQIQSVSVNAGVSEATFRLR